MIENLVCAAVVMFGFCLTLQALVVVCMTVMDVVKGFTKKD